MAIKKAAKKSPGTHGAGRGHPGRKAAAKKAVKKAAKKKKLTASLLLRLNRSEE